jgi:hypothetical protein
LYALIQQYLIRSLTTSITLSVLQIIEFKTCEEKLNNDLFTLLEYYKKWKLKPNPSKTESIMFHLNNKLANQKLNINFDGIQVQ